MVEKCDGITTGILISPDFFAIDSTKDARDLVELCLKLKSFLEPKTRYSADINRQVNSGQTALHNAVACVCFFDVYNNLAPAVLCDNLLGREAVDQLMRAKIEDGLIPADTNDVKISFGELIVEYLCKQGANVNAKNGADRTPIFFATRPDIIYALRRNGADLTQKGRAICKHLHFQGRDNNVRLSAVYDRIKEGNIPAIEAFLEYIPGQKNLKSKHFYELANGRRYYREGEYIVWLKGNGDRPQVASIQREPSQRATSNRPNRKRQGR